MYRRSGLLSFIVFIFIISIIIDIFRLIIGLLGSISGALFPLILIIGICYICYQFVNNKEWKDKIRSAFNNKKQESKDEIARSFASKNDVNVTSKIKVSKDNFYHNFDELIIRYNNEVVGTVLDLNNLYPNTYIKLKNRFVAISKLKNKEENLYKANKIEPNVVEEKINSIAIDKVAEVTKPQVSDYILATESRIETLAKLLINTDYGSNNGEYVKGHKRALILQYRKAYESTNLSNYEEELQDLINNYSSQTLEDKGYYDGLIYVLKALKKTKELFLQKVNDDLIKEL